MCDTTRRAASVAPTAAGGGESIRARVARLNQLLSGQAYDLTHQVLVGQEGLLDTLVVLYDECCCPSLAKNQYIAAFVNKYADTVRELKKQRISIDDFSVKEVIGRGHFGEVKVVREKMTGDVFALKVLRKVDTLAQQNVAFYEEERDIMAKSTSIWITQLHYAFQDSVNLYLVMEFHPGGDLLSLLARYDDMFEESMTRFYLAEMIVAIHTLHTMGYVHRDIKPENILIDRTGHIKLADFGSACKLASRQASVANMPVGTPDYISPEVLLRMNGDDASGGGGGRFGPECDWWSVGVCAYEMLAGNTPFSDAAGAGSMVVTYANIMNHAKYLKFPTDVDISQGATSLIRGLLSSAADRLSYKAICVHAFFAEINFDNIRQTKPPFLPTVTCSDDTSNFEEFDKARPPVSVTRLVTKTGFSGKDLPFIGFTFTKGLGLERSSSTLSRQVSSPACQASLERRLAAKCAELASLRERCEGAEGRAAAAKRALEAGRSTEVEGAARLRATEAERDRLERELAIYVTEAKSMRRLLELEKVERENVDSQATRLLADITERAQHAERLRDEAHRLERDELMEVLEQLEVERSALRRHADTLEAELTRQTALSRDSTAALGTLTEKLTQAKTHAKSSNAAFVEKLESRGEAWAVREAELSSRIHRVESEKATCLLLLDQVRSTYSELQEELYEAEMKSGLDATLRDQLRGSEEKRRSLETRLYRLSVMEEREEQLKEQVEQRAEHISCLADQLTDMEEELERRGLQQLNDEAKYMQRTQLQVARIQSLEKQVETLRGERNAVAENSLVVFEENEHRQKILAHQDTTISSLRLSVSELEAQLARLRDKVISELRCPTPCTHFTQACQTVTPPLSRLSRARSEQLSANMSLAGRRDCWRDGADRPTNISVTVKVTRTTHKGLFGQGDAFDPLLDTAIAEEDSDATASVDSSRDERATAAALRHAKRPAPTSVACQAEIAPEKPRTAELACQSEPAAAEPARQSFSCQTGGDVSRTSFSCQTDRHVSQAAWSCRADAVERTAPRSFFSDPLADVGRASGRQAGRTTDSAVARSSFACQTEEGPGRSSFSCQTEEAEGCLMESFTCQTDDVEPVGLGVEEEGALRFTLEGRLQELDHLQQDLVEERENTHRQRIRALDLKHELHEKTSGHEELLDALSSRLAEAQLQLSESTQSARLAEATCESTRTRLDKTQQQLDSLRLESRGKIVALQEERDEFQMQLKVLEKKYSSLQTSSSELHKASEELEQQLRSTAQRCSELAPKNKDLDGRLSSCERERGRLEVALSAASDQLADKSRTSDALQIRITQLKTVSEEMEGQLLDYDALTAKQDAKQTAWSDARSALEKSLSERNHQLAETQRLLLSAKQARQQGEERVTELTATLDAVRTSTRTDATRSQRQLAEQKGHTARLTDQLTQVEKDLSMLDVDKKGLQRRFDILYEESNKLKEEVSRLITASTELKGSNLQLGQSLETAVEKYEMLTNQNVDLEGQMETADAHFSEDRYKMESTLSQQTKLIEYLQVKVEEPAKKRKLFVSRRVAPPGAIQYRELKHSYEHERDKNQRLQQRVEELRDELHQANALAERRFSTSSARSAAPRSAGDVVPSALSSIVTSPASSSRLTGAGWTSRPIDRMHHNIPHRFVTGLNSKATKCAVCLGSVHFVKLAAKCQECSIICHPKCAPSLQATCGLPSEYARHYTSTLSRARHLSTTDLSKLSVANLRLQLQGWMKVPRAGKHIWDERWVLLENNSLYVYAERCAAGAPNPIDTFELCPSHGEVSVHSAVTAVELMNTASSDMPYVMHVQYEPNTTCWPPRSLYLMALSFVDKQKWVATLEAITNYSGKEDRINSAKVIGEKMLSVVEDPRLEVNSILPLTPKLLLLAADDGLYLLPLDGSHRLHELPALDSAYLTATFPGIDSIAVITERDRRLVLLDGGCLRDDGIEAADPDVVEIDGVTAVTTLAWGVGRDGIYLCVATADTIGLYKYNLETAAIALRKELPIAQACSCLYFGKNHIFIGTDKFYKIDLDTYTLTPLLDKQDATLAFAAFGAAHYSSFPIAVLPVSPEDEPEELLLCFNEFGCFVNCNGKRTREQDIKWSGLPLTFAYRQPYLYITYFNTLQVLEIRARHCPTAEGVRTFLNVFSPRHLGPALAPGAVYIGSAFDNTAEVICFRGNMVTDVSGDSDKENGQLAVSLRKAGASRRRPLGGPPSSQSSESGFVSPDDTSDTPIRKMSTSPGQRQRQRRRHPSLSSVNSDTSSVASSERSHDSETRVKVAY